MWLVVGLVVAWLVVGLVVVWLVGLVVVLSVWLVVRLPLDHNIQDDLLSHSCMRVPGWGSRGCHMDQHWLLSQLWTRPGNEEVISILIVSSQTYNK